MTVVLGFSGKKQSGKDTLLNNIKPLLNGTVKQYNFADGLKNFLVDVMGLRQEQVWGTEEQKNTKTTYLWENLPEFIRWENGGRWVDYGGKDLVQQLPLFEKSIGHNDFSPEKLYANLRATSMKPINLKSGPMTGREIMQVMGTDICRRMFSQHIWVHATFRLIAKDNVDFAIIPDLRFPSELQGVQQHNGLVVRLTRNIIHGDEHPSETALDGYEWSRLGDKVLLVPANLNIEETKDFTWNWLSQKLEK
jgi:hypothetical protein